LRRFSGADRNHPQCAARTSGSNASGDIQPYVGIKTLVSAT
jgi:hypothetical protein